MESLVSLRRSLAQCPSDILVAREREHVPRPGLNVRLVMGAEVSDQLSTRTRHPGIILATARLSICGPTADTTAHFVQDIVVIAAHQESVHFEAQGVPVEGSVFTVCLFALAVGVLNDDLATDRSAQPRTLENTQSISNVTDKVRRPFGCCMWKRLGSAYVFPGKCRLQDILRLLCRCVDCTVFRLRVLVPGASRLLFVRESWEIDGPRNRAEVGLRSESCQSKNLEIANCRSMILTDVIHQLTKSALLTNVVPLAPWALELLDVAGWLAEFGIKPLKIGNDLSLVYSARMFDRENVPAISRVAVDER